MGIAIHTVAGTATGTVDNATHAFAPGAGDSFAVRNFAASATAALELLVGQFPTANDLQVRSPALHDVAKGIHEYVGVMEPVRVLPQSNVQLLVAQDALIVELVQRAVGTAAANCVALGMYYSDLPGASARLHSQGDISGNIKYITTVRVDVVKSGVSGQWASAALNSAEDLFHANKDYAILGYIVEGAACAVALHGDDTSNYRVGGPGSAVQSDTRDFFWEESDMRSTPHIPVFNAANKASTYVDVVDNGVAGTVSVFMQVAELVANLSA